jgi:hypothetical protein
MEIQNCLMAFYENPDEMHELIDMYTEWELALAVERCLAEHGKHYFIPGASLGLATSNHPGVYDCTAKWIDEGSKKYF